MPHKKISQQNQSLLENYINKSTAAKSHTTEPILLTKQQQAATIVQDSPTKIQKPSKTTSSSSSQSQRTENKRDFWKFRPQPECVGRTFFFQGKQYNSLTPIFSFYEKKHADKAESISNFNLRTLSLYDMAFFLRELAKFKQASFCPGYDASVYKTYEKKRVGLTVFPYMLKFLENNSLPINDTNSKVEKEFAKAIVELYEFMLQYMSTNYVGTRGREQHRESVISQ